MKCLRCGAEIDDKYKFCPECGKKNITTIEEMKSAFSNGDYLQEAKGEELEKLWKQMQDLDANGLYDWLRAPHPPVECYVIHAEYETATTYNGKKIHRFCSRNISPATLKNLSQSKDVWNLTATVVKKQLRRADLRGLGVRVFMTAAECWGIIDTYV